MRAMIRRLAEAVERRIVFLVGVSNASYVPGENSAIDTEATARYMFAAGWAAEAAYTRRFGKPWGSNG